MIIKELTDEEIAAAIQRSGWVLSTKESVREFRGIATALAHQLEMKNSDYTVPASTNTGVEATIPGGWALLPGNMRPA